MKKSYTIPIEQNKIDQLYNLWLNNGYETKEDIDIVENHLLGFEKDISEIKLYTFENPSSSSIESSCITIYNKNLPIIAGLGEVCTEITSRGNGLAGKLCAIAKEDFFSKERSEGIFLGTVNPIAQKIYEKLGWVQIPKSKVMFNSKKGESFQDFIDGYYDEKSDIFINNGSPKFRISLIAYFLSQISDYNVDINVGIIGNNYSSMCLSLYNKFDEITKNNGQWFVMSNHKNKIFSTSSFKNISKDILRLDGTYRKGYEKYFIDLLKNNLRIIDLNSPKRIICEILEKDQDKIELFKELGFLESKNYHKNTYEKGKVFSILERK
tara:strand:+ start:999 stop:1970 length:972 start_codon:yes stop_codon:yes gene_type:complete